MSRQESAFTRELGDVEATAIGLGTLIGGGIFVLPSIAAANAGPVSAISFALAGIISLLAALSHAELATAMLRSGGGYRYVERTLGTLARSVVGWGMWIGLIFASVFYAVGFAQYMRYFIGGLPIAVVAGVLSSILIGLNYYGTAEVGTLQDPIVVSLLILLVAFVGLVIFAVNAETLRPFAPEGWAAVVSTTGIVYVALIGFSLIATVAESIENPGRNVPLLMITAVALPTILYVPDVAAVIPVSFTRDSGRVPRRSSSKNSAWITRHHDDDQTDN